MPTLRSLGDAHSSETARSRREKRSQSGLGRNRPRTYRSSAILPPVLTRTERAVLPIKERLSASHGRPKRQVKMALNVPGAEIRLPALPMIQLNWRVASGMIVALLAALLFHWWSSPTYRVDSAEIIGIQRITSNDINVVLGLSGASIFSVDPLEIKEELEKAFPDLKSIAIKISLPAKVVATVEERQPVLAWQQGGKLLWVDAGGTAFPVRGEAGTLIAVDAKDMPPGTQSNPVKNTVQFDPQWIKAFESLAAKAPQGTALVYSVERGMGWNDPQGWQVFFGIDLSDLDMKLLVYEALVKQLQAEGITPALVSVEYVHAPYYRMER